MTQVNKHLTEINKTTSDNINKQHVIIKSTTVRDAVAGTGRRYCFSEELKPRTEIVAVSLCRRVSHNAAVHDVPGRRQQGSCYSYNLQSDILMLSGVAHESVASSCSDAPPT